MELFRPFYRNQYRFLFWFLITSIWLISTYIDRSWWNNSNLVPAWDQADYLNSALDHARALSFLGGDGASDLSSFLDKSPAIEIALFI